MYLSMIIFAAISGTLSAQEKTSPYNARSYFEAGQNVTYLSLGERKNNGLILSEDEEQYLNEYQAFLESFYDKLSEAERIKYEEYKVQWAEELEEIQQREDSDIFEANRMGIRPGRKFLLSNGIYGFSYGLGAIYALQFNADLAIALPFISAGISMAYPLMNPKKYEGIEFSTVLLTRHGKFIGLLDGAALGFLAFGDPSGNEALGRAIMATTIAGSIALGEAGFQLGKKKNFPEGKVATYRYYALLTPYLAFSGLVAGNVEDARIYGATVLAAGAAGYLYGDYIYRKYHFSRGDMLAASSFGLLATGLGFGISPMEEPWHMLIPAATALGATFATQAMFKNTKHSSKQGWNINYASIVGVVIGFGAVFAIQPMEHNLVLALPAATGLAGWAIYASKYRKQQLSSSINDKKSWADLSFNFTPQNYFLNKQISRTTASPMSKNGLPVFSISIKL